MPYTQSKIISKNLKSKNPGMTYTKSKPFNGLDRCKRQKTNCLIYKNTKKLRQKWKRTSYITWGRKDSQCFQNLTKDNTKKPAVFLATINYFTNIRDLD